MHANFTFQIIENIVVIEDMNSEDAKSVTNDIDYVLAEINKAYPLGGKKVVYRDSDGIWDGINQKNGNFIGFYPIRTRDQSVALETAIKGQMRFNIAIPPDLPFEALKLDRDPTTGDIIYDLDVIKKIEEFSNLPRGFFTNTHEDNLSGLLIAWYGEHIKAGGRGDPVMSILLEEIMVENTFDCVNVRSSHKLQ